MVWLAMVGAVALMPESLRGNCFHSFKGRIKKAAKESI
jgi:hypothetical protein